MLNNPIIFAIVIWLIIEATYFINKVINRKTNWFKSDSDKNINIADGNKPKRMLISFTKTLKSKYNGNSGWRLYDDLTDDISYTIDGIDGFQFVSDGFNRESNSEKKLIITANMKLIYTEQKGKNVDLKTLFKGLPSDISVKITEL